MSLRKKSAGKNARIHFLPCAPRRKDLEVKLKLKVESAQCFQIGAYCDLLAAHIGLNKRYYRTDSDGKSMHPDLSFSLFEKLSSLHSTDFSDSTIRIRFK